MLENFGTGIHDLILLCCMLMLNTKSLVCIEEPEIHLHPELQRKFIKFLFETDHQYLITTHSNVFLDSITDDISVYHFKHDNTKTSVSKCLTDHHARGIIKDLGFKPSELLHANGVIWVEGPSDAVYLKMFLELIDKRDKLKLSLLNYSIQCLSTAIWKYAGFLDFDWEKVDSNIEGQIISLAKINHNHLIILDKDENYENKRPSEWETFKDPNGIYKAKLLNEAMVFSNYNENELESNDGDCIGSKLFFWINEGTIESYLKYFIENTGKENFAKYFHLNKTLSYYEKKRTGKNSSISKVELSINIEKYSLDNNLSLTNFAENQSHLENKLIRLCNTIKSWN